MRVSQLSQYSSTYVSVTHSTYKQHSYVSHVDRSFTTRVVVTTTPDLLDTWRKVDLCFSSNFTCQII